MQHRQDLLIIERYECAIYYAQPLLLKPEKS